MLDCSFIADDTATAYKEFSYRSIDRDRRWAILINSSSAAMALCLGRLFLFAPFRQCSI